jgi:ATP-dependent exoDNAse (exonuclease V) alpha subunit
LPQILKSLKVPAGLFNGALGYVTEFGPPRSDGQGPQCVYVRFDNYNGIPFGLRQDIPIIVHKGPANSVVDEICFQREAYPLQLAFGITCHKAQGCELRKVVIGLPNPGASRRSLFFRMAPSIFFTALSRVKSLNDVAFSKPFCKELVVKEIQSQHLKNWLAEEQRLIDIEKSM